MPLCQNSRSKYDNLGQTMKLGKTFLKTVCHCATLAQRNNAGSALVVREMLKVFMQNHNSNLSKSWYGLFNNFIYFDCWKLFLAQIWHNGTRTKTDLCHILCHRCDAKTYLIITTNSYLQTKTNYVITRQANSDKMCKNRTSKSVTIYTKSRHKIMSNRVNLC